jgi:SAM-dependent methyltransferase
MDYSYIGSELDVFSKARNWKAYCKRLISDYLGDDVLEVGAGIGATTKALCDGKQTRWVCVERDPRLLAQISALLAKGQLPKCCEARLGTTGDLSLHETFDTILYIDVLEHIRDDADEVERASQHLKAGGFLVVVAPAHQQLFSPFDASIGHYRRYNKRSLSKIMPSRLQRRKLFYVDSIGVIASTSNRFILRSKMPTARQIEFWDRVMVPVSRIVDPLLGYTLGKSVGGVWQK